jgi:hypothetical protein
MKTKNKLMQTANFLEEFAWFLKSKRNVDLEESANILRDFSLNHNSNIEQSPTDSKVNDLVGVLPFLFQDKELFQYNKDIIEFAENLFNIRITRPNKRTRYELIGLIVTEVTKLNNNKLKKLIESISLITSDIDKLTEIKNAKKEINFNWNNAISNLNR